MSLISPLVWPLALLQGLWLKYRVPKLPEAPPPHRGKSEGGDKVLQLLLIGESTAAGVGATTHDEGLAGQLALQLTKRYGFSVEWRVLGKNGAKLESLAPLLDEHRRSYDLVFVATGVNDAKGLTSPRRFLEAAEKLCRNLRKYSAAPICFLQMPNVGDFPVIPRPLSHLLSKRSHALEIAFLPWLSELKQIYYLPSDFNMDMPELFAVDGFHPSKQGYALWAEKAVVQLDDICQIISLNGYAKGKRLTH